MSCPEDPTSTVKFSRKRTINYEDDQVGKRQKLDEDAFNPLLTLPTELILKIFKYLDTEDLMDLSMTCQYLHDLCYDPLLWKRIKLTKLILTSNTLKQYLNFANEHTEELYIKNSYCHKNHKQRYLTFEDLYEIKVKCPNLKILHIENQSLDAFEIFCSSFPRTLTELSLKDCHLLNEKYANRFFNGMDTYFLKLEKLILKNCLWVTAHSIMVISKLPSLRHLNVAGCLQLNNFMPYLSLSTQYGFKNLESCNLRNTFINDSEASCFAYCKNLRELYFQAPDDNLTIAEIISVPDDSLVVSNDILKLELEQLRKLVPIIQAKFEGKWDPRSKILSNNFNWILQDLGKCYTKLHFHRLFLNLVRLDLLVDLENGTIANDIVENIDISKFQNQIRLPLNCIIEINPVEQPNIIINSISEVKFKNDNCRYTRFNSKLQPKDTNFELFVSRIDQFPISSNVPSTESKPSGSSVETYDTILDRNFIQSIYDATNQSSDVECQEFVSNEEIGLNHVIVAISNNPNGGPPVATTIAVPTNEFYLLPQRRFIPEIHEGSEISDRTVRTLFGNRAECVKLEKVSFRNYRHVTNLSVVTLGNAKNRLKFIDISGTRVMSVSSLRGYKPDCEIIATEE